MQMQVQAWSMGQGDEDFAGDSMFGMPVRAGTRQQVLCALFCPAVWALVS